MRRGAPPAPPPSTRRWCWVIGLWLRLITTEAGVFPKNIRKILALYTRLKFSSPWARLLHKSRPNTSETCFQNSACLSLVMIYVINVRMGSLFQYHSHGVAALPGHSFIIFLPPGLVGKIQYKCIADLPFLFYNGINKDWFFLIFWCSICLCTSFPTFTHVSYSTPINIDNFSSSDIKHFPCDQFCLWREVHRVKGQTDAQPGTENIIR